MFMKKIFLTVLILAFSFQVYPVIYFNDLNCLFSEGPEKAVIDKNMVSGSTYFLESKAFADLLLMEYEKSSNQVLDFDAALGYAEKALACLEKAKEFYVDAKNTGAKIGYIDTKKKWFHSFNYDQLIALHKMNKEIAGKAKNYLANADVVGIYQQNITNLDIILTTLTAIRDQLKVNQKPGTLEAWNLFQQYSHASLFGNYATIMGITVLGGGPDSDPCED